MKKMLIGIAAALAGAMAFAAGQEVKPITFYTNGPDTYAKDGKPLLAGEFYALVWTKDAATPIAFNADGTIKGDAKLITARPLAEISNTGKSRCKYDAYQPASSAELDGYATGVLHLLALDTRKADGTLSGYTVDENGVYHPNLVDGYTSVFDAPTAVASLLTVAGVNLPISVNLASEVPEGTPQPVITSATLRDGANGKEFVIRVKDTSPYLNYTAASVTASGEADSCPLVKDGTTSSTGASDPEAEIEIVIPATANSGLFKVIRK